MKGKKIFISTIILTFVLAGNVFAAQGTIVNGRTMVPVRGVFEELGFNVSWDSEQKQASIKDDKHQIIVPQLEESFYVDGQKYTPDVPAQLINGSMYLPLKAIGDCIGAETSWNNDSKVAHISYEDKNSYVSCASKNTTSSSKNSSSTSVYESKQVSNNNFGIDNTKFTEITNFHIKTINDILNTGDIYELIDLSDRTSLIYNKYADEANDDYEKIFVLLLHESAVSTSLLKMNYYRLGITSAGKTAQGKAVLDELNEFIYTTASMAKNLPYSQNFDILKANANLIADDAESVNSIVDSLMD
jgi:hypothetical protein